MSSTSVSITYRPVRVAYCILKNDFESLDKISKINFASWGGPLNLFIVIDEEPLADILVKSYKPDLLLPASDSPQIAKFIEKYPQLQGKWTTENYASDKRLTLLDIVHPLDKLFKENLLSDPRNKPYIPQWSATDPLSRLLLLSLGQYPNTEEIKTNYQQIVLSDGIGELLPPLNETTMLPTGLLESINPYRVSRLFLREKASWQKSFSVFIGDVSSFMDLVSFWNLRAFGYSIVFYDPSHSNRLIDWLNFQLDRQRRVFKDDDVSNAIKIFSRSQEALNTHETILPKGERRILALLSNNSWDYLNMHPSFFEISDCNTLGAIHDSEGVPSLSFELKEQPFQSTHHAFYQHYMASIKPFFYDEGKEFTFNTIHHPEMNEFYEREMCRSFQNELRSEEDGLGFLLRISTDYLRIYAVNKELMIDNLFKTVGLTLKTSKAGLIAKQIYNQIGSIHGCRMFKIEGVRTLLNEVRPDQWFDQTKALTRIGNVDPTTNKPRFEKYEQLILKRINGRLEKGRPVDVFRYLLEKKILRPGLAINCKSCLMEYWNNIDEVGSLMTCSYCGHEQEIATDLMDLKWQYRKSGLFADSNNQEGAIPVLTTLQQLSTCYSTSPFLFRFSASIKGQGINCESDFIAVAKGRENKIRVVLSECKTHGTIEENDLKNLSQVAAQFPKDRFDLYILLSKFSDFSTEEIEIIKKFQGAYRNRIILWSNQELEPYDVYEHTRGKYVFEEYNVQLDGLANATSSIYLNPILKKRPQEQNENT